MDPVQPRFIGFLLLIMAHGATILASGPPVTQLTPNPIPDATWTEIDSFAIDPSATWVVYESDPASANADQVLSVPIVGGSIVEVSLAGTTGNIQEYQITGNGSRVVYRASNTLSSALIGGGGHVVLPDTFCDEWSLSPDGSMVAYIASGPLDGCGACDGPFVWAVPSAGGMPEVIGLPFDTFNDWVSCFPITVSPQGGWLTFNTYEGGLGSTLNITTWDGSGNEDVAGTFEGPAFSKFAPDDSRLFGFMGSQGLYSHSLSVGSSGYVYSGDYVAAYAVSPVPVLGRYRLIYGTFQGEVYSLPIHQLDGEVTLFDSGGTIAKTAVTPDGENVVFEEGDDDILYAVPTIGGTVQPLSGPEEILAFEPASDSQHVVYRARELPFDVWELFVVPIEGGTPLRISTDLPAWGDVIEFSISSDAQTVVYRADVEEDSAFQLFAVPITGGQSLEIGGDIEAGAPRSVRSDFAIAPGDDHVVYRTGFVSGDPAEVLFSVALDTDADGDDVLDSVDCDGGDAGVWALPGEVTGLTLARQEDVPEVAVLNWTPPGDPGGQTLRYDVLRTDSAAAYITGGPIDCVATAVSDPEAQDAEVPEAAYFYLARAVNDCGNGGGGVGREAADAHVCE